MINQNDLQDKFSKIYKKEITIREFENWIYENDSIEQVVGEDLYFQLVSIDYNHKNALTELEKLLFPLIDYKEIKKIIISNIMKDILVKYISMEFNKEEVVLSLIENINMLDVIEYDDEFFNDCFFALYHINEIGFETMDYELVYLKECFEGKRMFSRKERDAYISNSALGGHYV